MKEKGTDVWFVDHPPPSKKNKRKILGSISNLAHSKTEMPVYHWKVAQVKSHSDCMKSIFKQQSSHRFWIGFQSGLWLSHSITWSSFNLNHSLWLLLNLFSCSKRSYPGLFCLALSILSSMFRFPVAGEQRYPHNIMQPVKCCMKAIFRLICQTVQFLSLLSIFHMFALSLTWLVTNCK